MSDSVPPAAYEAHAGPPDVLSPDERSALSRVVAVAVGKGGTGKTSVSTAVAGILAMLGYKVLIVDFDPQASGRAGGNLGDDLGYAGIEGLDDHGEALRASILSGEPLRPVQGVRDNLDVVPGGKGLKDVLRYLWRTDDPAIVAQSLARVLAPIASQYDLVIVDCPPGDEPLQLAALGAAKYVVIPFRSDSSSRKGVYAVGEAFQAMLAYNPSLVLLGVVLFAIGRSATRTRAIAEQDVHDAFGGNAPFLGQGIRDAEAAATMARENGLLIHEMTAEGKELRASIFKNRVQPPAQLGPLPRSAHAVAQDQLWLANDLMRKIQQHEEGTNA